MSILLTVYIGAAYLASIQYNLYSFSSKESSQKCLIDTKSKLNINLNEIISQNRRALEEVKLQLNSYHNQIKGYFSIENGQNHFREHLEVIAKIRKEFPAKQKEINELILEVSKTDDKKTELIQDIYDVIKVGYNRDETVYDWVRKFESKVSDMRSYEETLIMIRKDITTKITTYLGYFDIQKRNLEAIKDKSKKNTYTLQHIEDLKGAIKNLERLKNDFGEFNSYKKVEYDCYPANTVLDERYSNWIYITSSWLIDLTPLLTLLTFIVYQRIKEED